MLLLPGLLIVGLAVSGCVAPAARQAGAENFNDPFEDTNRAIFRFNERVDHAVLIPAAKAYRVLPDPVRDSIHNVVQNLNEPVIFMNDVLQGQGRLASDSLGRVIINTTIGLGGLFDVATPMGLPYHPNDLGITLAVWGVAEGPYVVVPVLGPSNPRDLAGQVGDSFADPGDYVAGQYHRMWASVARSLVSGIDVRSRNLSALADLERTSLDYYATIRSLYRQRRESLIRHEKPNLPNPTTLQAGDPGPGPAISFSIATVPQFSEAAAK
jgi:phospholipid-binding lipoprotein MlaA